MTYSLAGVVNPETGWGFRDEAFRAHDQLAAYGRPAWFHLGDRDLATHIHRTAMLREGATLSEAAESIRLALGVQARILPMCDQPVPTMIDTEQGRLNFQQYLVQRAGGARGPGNYHLTESNEPCPRRACSNRWNALRSS